MGMERNESSGLILLCLQMAQGGLRSGFGFLALYFQMINQTLSEEQRKN